MKYCHTQAEYLGTQIYLSLGHSHGEILEDLSNTIFAEAKRIEEKFSRFLDTSALSILNTHLNTWHIIDREFFSLLEFATALRNQTNGFLDPSVHRVLESWGYDKKYSLQYSEKNTQLGDIILKKNIGEENTTQYWAKISAPIDIGSFGKGYFLDRAKNIAQEFECENFLINAGGDLFAKGYDEEKIPWKIFFEDPRNLKRVIGEFEIPQSGIFACSSSPTRRKWRNVHHLVNPKSLSPADDIQSVYIQNIDSGIVCDALSTAIFVMGYEKGKNFLDVQKNCEGIIIGTNGELWQTKNFQGKIFLTS